MSASRVNFPAGGHVTFIVPNVFEIMLALPVSSADSGMPPGERISGALGIAGDQVNGTIYLHVPAALAWEMAGVIHPATPGQGVSERDVHDVVGELTNMIGGSLKSLLNDADIACGISPPSVVQGAFTAPPPGVDVEKYFFECLGHRFAVAVHLQFNGSSLCP